MVNIIGKYQHERDENIDEFFQILGVAYIDMMGMSNSELEITRNKNEWKFETVTSMGVQTSMFTLDKEYKEITPSGAVLKNTTTLAGNSLITIFITRQCNVIIRRYDFTVDGVVLKILLARCGTVAMRYFKRKNIPETSSQILSNIGIARSAAVAGGSLALAASPFFVATTGFTSARLSAGGMAASKKSALGSRANATGGAVATSQSVGALGTVLCSTAATAMAVGTNVATETAIAAGTTHATAKNYYQKRY